MNPLKSGGREVKTEQTPNAAETGRKPPIWSIKTPIWFVRTTVGQERNVLLIAEDKTIRQGIPIKSMLLLDSLKGYVLVEADAPHFVEAAFSGIKHVRGASFRKTDLKEIERFLVPKSPLEGLKEGDVAEVIGGPFRGLKGRVIKLDTHREEVTLELLEAAYTLPIKVHGDLVKRVKAEEGRGTA